MRLSRLSGGNITFASSENSTASLLPTLLVASSGSDVPPPVNQAPVVTSLSASALSADGTSVDLSVVASDPDGDDLTYAWLVHQRRTSPPKQRRNDAAFTARFLFGICNGQ